jgi:hypothetical protein
MILLADLIKLADDLAIPVIVRYNNVVVCGVEEFIEFTIEEKQRCQLRTQTSI